MTPDHVASGYNNSCMGMFLNNMIFGLLSMMIECHVLICSTSKVEFFRAKLIIVA